MFTYGIHELESAGVIPYMSGKIEVEKNTVTATRMNGDFKIFEVVDADDKALKKARKWSSRIWDINPEKRPDGSYPLMHDKGGVGELIKGLFGYNGDPSLVEFLSWVFSLLFLFYLWRRFNVKE